MTRLMKCLTAAAVVAGVGFSTQTARAGGPVKKSVVVFPTVPTVPHHHHHHHHHIPVVPRYPVLYPPTFVNPYPVYNTFPRIDFDYVVLYKPTIFGGAQVYGRYETLHQAQHAAGHLQVKGFATRIERFRDNGLYGW